MMTNFNTIEELRTKEELINYFKAMGKNITEEEIETLKKSYEEAEKNNGALTLEQLDDVAGGGFIRIHGGRVHSNRFELSLSVFLKMVV